MDPARHRNYETILPLIYMAKGDGEGALKWVKEQLEYRPHSRYQGWLAAIHGNAGDIELAKTHLASFLEQRPEITNQADYEKVVPTICKDFVMQGLVLAGLPAA